MPHRILYIDMDNVLVDFPSAILGLSEEDRLRFAGRRLSQGTYRSLMAKDERCAA